MTVTTTTSKETLTGNGVQTVFPFTIRLLTGGDLTIYIDDVLLVGGRTIAINDNGVGGTITFATAPANGADILLARVMTLTQETDLPTESNIPEATLETAYDRAVMLIQQVKEEISRGFTLPITSTLSGALATDGVAGDIVRKKLDGTGYEFVTPTVAFNDSTITLGTGNVVGPVASTDYTIVLWNGVGGKTLRDGVTLGSAGQILMSNGTGAAPTMVTRNWLFRAANITATARTLPTSGALSGTYIHFGDWTSTGALTYSHDTRIYIKGNITLGAGHTLDGTVQANGGTCGTSYAFSGGYGGGPGGGQSGMALHGAAGLGGGAGGGCGGAGGRGGWNGTSGANQGGRVHGVMTAGGSGGGSGSGDLGGTNLGQAGGGGGPFLYIECDGNIIFNETVSSNGAAGTVATTTGGAGGGGAGGVISIRASGTLTVPTGKKIRANGGAGGNENTNGRGGGGGGGGMVEVWTGGTQSLTDGAATTITAAAGAAGSGAPTTTPAAGAAGTTTVLASTAPISLF